MSTVVIGTVFVKQPNILADHSLSHTVPIINPGNPLAYSEFAGVTVRDAEPITSGGCIVRLQRTGIGLAQVRGPVSANDAVGLKDGIIQLAGTPDVPVGICLQNLPGPDPDANPPEPGIFLARVHFGVSAASPAGGQVLAQIAVGGLYGGSHITDEVPGGRVSYIGVQLKGPSNQDGFDANGLKGDVFKVAKSLAMRMPATENGCDLTYTDDSHRISDDHSGTTDENPESQQLTPLLGEGNLIFIERCNYSLAIPQYGTDLKWIVAATEFEWTNPNKRTYIDGTPV